MKTSLKALVASLAACAALITNASASTMYANGVTGSAGLTLTDLVGDGWSELVNVTYGTGLNNLGLQALATGTGDAYVFVGAIDAQGNLVVGATGLASEVLSYTGPYGNNNTVQYASSNLYWYNNEGSFGFTPTSNIAQNSADTTGTADFGFADDGNNALRLSWHQNGGGWRAGVLSDGSANIWLNDTAAYRKIVLTSNANSSSVPDAANSLILVGACFTMVAGARRLRKA